MKVEKENKMKEKILELIHKELENVGGENIFHNCYYYNHTPYITKRFKVKENDDTSTHISPDIMEFTLKFEDGEPDIRVYTQWDYSSVDEIYKTKYFGLKKFWSKVTTYKFTTKVICGHISFDLSDEESVELLKLTKESYAKYNSLKDALKDKIVLKKIKKRLKKHGN
jgi:hypothetical protein